MFILEEGNSILVYNKAGKLSYKSTKIKQYRKFNSDSLVVITDSTIDFISETKDGGRHDIVVVNDTKFLSAYIQDNLLFVSRKIGLPILDVYTEDFINTLRLYQSVDGSWVYVLVKLKIPYKLIKPTHLNGKIMYGIYKGKPCSLNLETQELKTDKVNPKGLFIGETLEKFRIGEVR